MNALVEAVWNRARAEHLRTLSLGNDHSFVVVSLDEWAAWIAFTATCPEDFKSVRACGEPLVIDWYRQ